MANINNTASNTLLSGTSKADSIQNLWGDNVTVDSSDATITFKITAPKFQSTWARATITLIAGATT